MSEPTMPAAAPRPKRDFAVIVLAAGQGTRMKSDLHKVLHRIAGKPMLLHLLDTVAAMQPARTVVVLGKGREQVEAALAGRDAAIAVQAEQLGTAHAVEQAAGALAGFAGPVLILYGDTPFVSGATLQAMLDRLGEGAPGAVVLASEPEDAKAYGRVILGDGDVIDRMVEYKDASEAERAVRLCNSGMMAVDGGKLFEWLGKIGNDNAAREYYLPDLVMVAAADGHRPVVVRCAPHEAEGINSRAELAVAEAGWQERRRQEAMRDGATLIAPQTVWFSHDTRLGRDVIVEPDVWFGPGVEVADGVTIHAFSHLEGCRIASGAAVGPYARLRPGAEIGARARVGNFVEVKQAQLGEGAKANHLSYIGDASVGAGANIGAGTITCNYDGFLKYRTEIGEGAFIGSNSALVAPVSIGAGAIVAAGSVVTREVEADSLCLVRPEQIGLAGWAKRFRAKMAAVKAGRSGG